MSHNERSRHITHGVARAPNRAMYYALGYQEADFENPMIGVANGHSTITAPTRRYSARPPSRTVCRWAPRA
jgi:dihydroxyacid dehydratase/phosphogluconate dehydratase